MLLYSVILDNITPAVGDDITITQHSTYDALHIPQHTVLSPRIVYMGQQHRT